MAATLITNVSKLCVLYIFYLLYMTRISNGSSHLCGKTNHNNSNGELVPSHDEIEAGHSCKWHIFPEAPKAKVVYIVFEIFELESNDICNISQHEGSKLFGPFSGKKQSFSVLSDKLYLEVIVEAKSTPSSVRKFRLSYSANECNHIMLDTSGHITSPLYKTVEDEIICTYEFQKIKTFNMQRTITFEEFKLINSTLTVTGSAHKDPLILTGTDIPNPIVVSNDATLELKLNRVVPNQIFGFTYSTSGIPPTCQPAQSTTIPSKSSNLEGDTGISVVILVVSILIAFAFGIMTFYLANKIYKLYKSRRQNDYGCFPAFDS